MDQGTEREFTAFVNARGDALLRVAYALAGDQYAAEDLLQNALAKAYARWPRFPVGRVVRDFPAADVHWISDDRLLYFDDVTAVLVDRLGKQIELSRLPAELVFLNISVAPR